MLQGLVYTLSILSIVSASAVRGGGRDQLSFQPPPTEASFSSSSSHVLNVNTSANYIFNSLTGALSQLPNTIHSNGHLLLPVTIPAHTTVYHARNDNGSVPSPDWVALDVEMSYGIMTGRSGGTWLSTFVSAREIKLVYFDGNSAALGTPGWLDTQDVLTPTKEDDTPGRPGGGWNGEFERAVRLCEWNEREKLGLDGFLRMNSGFEVMWCDFDSDALELVSRINITPPDVPPSTGGGPWDRGGGGENHHHLASSSPRDSWEVDVIPPPEGSYPGRGPGGGRGGPPGRGRGSIYSSSSRFEWLHVSTHRYHLPQHHITADWSSFVTFYHPRLSSLVQARKGVPWMGEHQVKRDASKADISSVLTELVEVLRRGSGKGSGIDWSQLAKDVVERYGDRIANLNHILNGSSSSSSSSSSSTSSHADESTNFTLVRTKLSVLTYTMLDPFLDTTHLANTSSSSSPSSLWLPPTLQRCSTYLTRTVPHSTLTDQERLLKASIDFVTGRICSEIGEMFEESLLGSRKGREEESEGLVKAWRARVKELMSWLDWSIWTRCEEACSWNEICAIPMWPLTSRGGPRGDPDPKTTPVVPYCLALDGYGGAF